MSTQRVRSLFVRCTLILSFVLSPMLLATASMVMTEGTVEASSHREAPLISMDAFADNTDTYAFISPTNPDNIVLVASWIPFEGPEGGPNYWQFDPNAHYVINVDNNGDAVADHRFVLEATEEIQNPFTFLYNTGPIGSNGENWNRQQRYTLFSLDANGSRTDLVTNVLAPPVNIGSKSTPDYMSLVDNFQYDLPGGGTVYAGQTDDAFWVDLQVFDLLTLRGQPAPIGYSQGNNTPVDSVAGFNNHSIVLEIPIDQLTQGDEPVLGVWATAARKSMRVLNGIGGVVSGDGLETHSGDYVQVSRLGMPLVNEVVIPYLLKDAFNNLMPSQDLGLYTGANSTSDGDLFDTIAETLQKSVEDPEIGRLLCSLYGVPLPGDSDSDCSTEVDLGTPRSGRGDIFDIFLTGMVLANEFTIQTKNGPVTLPSGFNVNQPAGVQPAEMIRINTTIKGDLCSPMPSRLGVLGGDACGFPNGRRLFDDVVEIELLAVAGAAYPVLDGRDSSFSFNPGLIDVLDDGIDFNDVPFQSEFPYMATAQSGQEHIHDNPTQPAGTMSISSRIMDSSDDAEERANGTIKLLSNDLDLGDQGFVTQMVGMRFGNMGIPSGATILNARIQFVARQGNDNSSTLTFAAEDTDNAMTFSGNRYDLTNRVKTGSSVMWENVPAWMQSESYWTPNLAEIVQEVVNRDGWSESSYIAILVEGDGLRQAFSYDGAPDAAPLLYVEYRMGGDDVNAANVGLTAPASSVVSPSILVGEPNVPESIDLSAPDEDDVDGVSEEVDTADTIYLPSITR
ncbi:MAG: DUF4331 domain-containing protein [Caldilineaceae bacterium]|nr:DUF4331 domain-containing protein [Caldilineaceae bacterium]